MSGLYACRFGIVKRFVGTFSRADFTLDKSLHSCQYRRMTISRKELKDRIGVATDADLARFLGITAQAVGQWGTSIPAARERIIRLEHPELFSRLNRYGQNPTMVSVQHTTARSSLASRLTSAIASFFRGAR